MESTTLTLYGSGIIKGAASYHVTTEGVHLHPVLSAETRFTSPTPRLYAPYLTVMKSGEELQALKSFAGKPYFGTLATATKSHQSVPDIDTLFQIHAIKDMHTHGSSWYIPVLIEAATVIVLYIVFRLARTYVCGIRRCCSQGKPQESTSQDVIELETPTTTHQTPDSSES
jgi:hypothetical protein